MTPSTLLLRLADGFNATIRLVIGVITLLPSVVLTALSAGIN